MLVGNGSELGINIARAFCATVIGPIQGTYK